VKGRWATMEKLDRIVAAQREAALANRCAFWDMQEKMGGKGAMREWVTAGLAQGDHVHFTTPGYRRLGYTLFRISCTITKNTIKCGKSWPEQVPMDRQAQISEIIRTISKKTTTPTLMNRYSIRACSIHSRCRMS